jgi:A/G-specific adenine glycosylase
MRMTSDRLSRLRQRLIGWYRLNRRPLPWRRTRDPYRIWVSEVMLQQTQVKTARPYYHRFLRFFPRVQDLARADLQPVLKAWEGLGYYARARNLHRAAARVVREHAGRIPDRWEPFRDLPGVGDYTAAAVLSIAFGRPHAAVDGNVRRVLARLLALEAPVNAAGARPLFQAHADRLLDRRRPGDFNQALMELGALICTPRAPDCGRCPLRRGCAASRRGRQADYPRRSAARTVPETALAVGVVLKNGRLLITQRQAEGLLGGLWEFPGGKIQPGETPAAACLREIREEVNLEVQVDRHLTRVKHAYSHFRIVMDVFCCRHVSGRVRLKGPVDFRWIRVTDLDRFPFPMANRKFIPLLRQNLAGAGPGRRRAGLP